MSRNKRLRKLMKRAAAESRYQVEDDCPICRILDGHPTRNVAGFEVTDLTPDLMAQLMPLFDGQDRTRT